MPSETASVERVRRGYPEQTLEWLSEVVAGALNVALDDIEREYRKLGTNLLEKEAAEILSRNTESRHPHGPVRGDRGVRV